MNTFNIVLSFIILFLFIAFFTSLSSADIYGVLDEDGYLRFSSFNNKKYDTLIKEVSQESGVEFILIKAIIKAESDFDNMAISRKGARGLMQLMPDTAGAMGVDDPHNPNENIIAGVRYISQLLSRFNNDKTLALAAYNAGPEIVNAYKGVPPFLETRNFIRKVLRYYKEYGAK